MLSLKAGLVRHPYLVAFGLIGAVALGLLIWFDLGPPLAFNDDFLFAWSVRQLAAGHGLRVLPEQAPLATVQVAWGTLVSLGQADPRVLRLSAVPFVLLAAGAVYYLSRHLGAAREWALLGSLSFVLTPFFLSVATSFMTDVFYAGLLMAAAVAGVRWVEGGRWRWTCCLLMLLAALERQNGVALAVALTAGLLGARSRRTVSRSEWLTLAGLWLAGGLVLALPSLMGLHTGAHRLTALLTANPLRLLRATTYFAPALGLVLAPFLVAVSFASRQKLPRSWFGLVPVILAEIGLLNLAIAIPRGYQVGTSYFSASALNPALLPGQKPAVYPVALFLLVQVIVLATFLVILIGHRAEWIRQRLGQAAIFLLVLSGTQLLIMLQGDVYDRYFIPVIAPLVPLVAVLASRTRRPKLAAGWACATLGLWLGLYVVGEQDYQAWQVARDQAARLAYQRVPPSQVDAGYEANAIYWEIPLYERTNRPVGAQPSDVYGEPSLVGPPNPILRLAFAGFADRRPGFDYSSMAPGRVVITPVPSPSPAEATRP